MLTTGSLVEEKTAVYLLSDKLLDTVSLCSETMIHSSCAVIFLAIKIIEFALVHQEAVRVWRQCRERVWKKTLMFRTCCVMLPFGEEEFVVCTEGNKAGLPGCFLPG